MTTPATPSLGPSPRRDWLPFAALGVLVLGMAFGALLPIYTDEIAWRYHERAWLDGGLDVWLNDVCPQMVAYAPAFMLPVRWFSATMNLWLDDPLWVRATGIVLGLALVAGFWRLIGQLEADPARRGLLRAIACALLASGYLPLLLVMSRPEQPLMLGTMAMLVLAVPHLGQAISARRAWLVSAGLVLLSLVVLSYHLKGLLYSVVALACLFCLGRGAQHWQPRALAAGAIVALDLVAGQYWLARFSCATNPVMASALETQNVVAMLVTGKATPAMLGAQIMDAHIFSYVTLSAIHPYPMSSWLPRGVFTQGEAWISHLLTPAAWLGGTVLAALALIAFLRSSGWRGLFAPRMVLVAALFGLTFVWGVSQGSRNVYEASHMLPAWIMLLLFALTLRPAQTEVRPATGTLRKLAVALLVVAVISQVIVMYRMSGPLGEAARDPGRLPRQQFSFSLVDYPGVRTDIARTMTMAGMVPGGASGGTGPDGRLNRPLLDDLTYLALQRSYMPLHALGVMGPWNGPIDKPAAFLVSRNSDGIVASCISLWDEAVAVAARSGEICAINRQALRDLSGGLPWVPATTHTRLPLAEGAYPRPVRR